MSLVYKNAGVNLESGYEVVRRIKRYADSTSRKGVMGSIGSFGGLFDLSVLGVENPVLVSSTDGVGTKLKVAFAMGKSDSIGVDAVAMCVNDVLAQGAEPLFFLDYIAAGVNNPDTIESVVSGVAEGCRIAGCALIGGETAEMPGMYGDGEYDITGFATGVVNRESIIDGSKVCAGDVLIGIGSSGVHSNGFSLVRKVLADNGIGYDDVLPEVDASASVGDVLLTPTRIYVKSVLEVMRCCDVHGVSHITGGGFDENLPRAYGSGLGVRIFEGSWLVHPIFNAIEKYGSIPHREMFNVFNMGIGMVLFVGEGDADRVLDILKGYGESASVIGSVNDLPGVNIIPC